MSTTASLTKPARRRRGTPAKRRRTVDPRACDRPAPELPFFMQIRFTDAKMWVSTRALARSGCPHCLVDTLVASGRLQYGSPLIAPYSFDPDPTGSPLSGIELAVALLHLCTPGINPLNEHPLAKGRC